jgi:flagellar basal-body rod protein FlgG
MIYGLYLSATGVLTSSYRQDVIANNLANAQTVGFKRSLAILQQRRTEAQQRRVPPGRFNRLLEGIGGGTLLSPTYVDHSRGQVEQTSNNLDVAIHGQGYFAVQDASGATRLTRNGQFLIDREGNLVLNDTEGGRRVLDAQGQPIVLAGLPQSQIHIARDGTISANGQVVARLGLFGVPDPQQLVHRGGTLLEYPGVDVTKLPAADGQLESGSVEGSNVDPMIELTQLINAHRQLEANANMIRYQDQTLGKLVNEVGRIG